MDKLAPMKPSPRRQRGSAAVEFAVVAVVFFTFALGVLEVARALYLWSTLTEVVSRAARGAAITNPYPADSAAMTQVRRDAMFGIGNGQLPLGGDIDASYLVIDYLAADGATVVAPPNCPAQNVVNCTTDPNGASCIRFVRARLCNRGVPCLAVPFRPIMSLEAFNALRIDMPSFAAVVPAQSLGLSVACTP